MSNDTQIAAHMALVEEYVGDYARATTENLYGTSKSYTKQCFEAANESRAAVEASARQLAEQLGFVMVPDKPVHWRALLDPAQRPHKLQTHHHVVGFTSLKACENFVAAELDMNGWRYTIEPLYNRPLTASPTTPSTEASEPVWDERADLIAQAGEEMSFEAWFKTMCPVDGINAKIAARAAWQARASKGTPL